MSSYLPTSITRSELEELIGVKASTFNAWWNKGHMLPPSDLGGSRKQGTFTVDEAFTMYVFTLVIRRESRKLEEASTVARYLQNRPGTFGAIYKNWSPKVEMRVYPDYDFAAFVTPRELILERAAIGAKRYSKEKIIEEGKWFTIHHHYKLEESESNNPFDAYPKLVEDTLRSMRAKQIPKVSENFTLPKPEANMVEYSRFSRNLHDDLLLEAWTLEHIDDGLKSNILVNKYKKTENFIVDVTDAIKGVAKIFRRSNS
jgi:hypothetical protein